MASLVKGIHHITVCASTAQEDIDFMTKVAGQRLIKQTVLFDGRYAHYHLYYANANAEVGSVFTTFPYKRVPGRVGSGQVQSTAYSVLKGSLSFWASHFLRHGVENSGIQERLGERFIRFTHPSGLLLEVVETTGDERAGWTTGEISADVANRGFFGPVLSVRELDEQARFLTEALGFRRTGSDGPYHRFEVGDGGPSRTLLLHHEPERTQGSWGFGAGTGHHVALEVDNDDALAAQKGLYEELGYTDCSEIKDRNYFHSIYVRSPGGVLVECAATADGGFTRDEPWEQLGTSLLLPPWFEEQRPAIVAMLEPVTVPAENQPTAEGVAARRATIARSGGSTEATARSGAAVASRRTSAEFIGGDT
jgi:glyoxalase family protein